MKRLILTAAVASALGLTGCGGGDSQSDYLAEEQQRDPVAPIARIQFDPAAGKVPVPNDLLFLGTPDGTLNFPTEASGSEAQTKLLAELAPLTDIYRDPQTAIGALGGWSTTSPISINVDLLEGAAGLDTSSAEAPGAVRLFEVTLEGALTTDAACAAGESLHICEVGDELQYGTDFAVSASTDSIAIVPIKPLKPKSSYVYVTTTSIRDTDGATVKGSLSFDTLRLDLPGLTPEQQSLKAILDDYIADLAAAHSVDSDSVTYAGSFTTQSIQDSVVTVSQLMADGLSETPQRAISPLFSPVWQQLPTDIGVNVAQALSLPVSSDPSYLLAAATDIYRANLQLPYYLPSPTLADAPLEGNAPAVNGRWQAFGDSPLAVLQAVQTGALLQENFATQAAAQGIDPISAISAPASLVGASFTLDNGEPADPTRHISRFNPVPMPQSTADVAVQITVPTNVAKPATGWPVAITMHGLGGTKETTLPLAGAYTSQGIATISIDMPLHGERGFARIGGGEGPFAYSATNPAFGDEYVNGSPLLFVKIDSGLTNRDNFRQAIVDHLGLRLALSALTAAQVGGGGEPMFDMTKVSLQGLSLGAIVGTSVTAYANSWDSAAFGPNPYALTNASLVAPAGGLAGSFAGSASFGPVLMQSLVGQIQPACLDPMTGAIVETEACAAVVAAIEADVIPEFALASQTAVDAIDPLNHAAMLAATATPVHLIEIVGDDMLPGDLVLPNSVAGFPLSGTEPLIANLGLAAVTETQMDAAGVSGAVRFSKGHHSSVASPLVPAELTGILSPADALAATVEMQTQVVGHAASQGGVLPVTNGCVIQGGSCEE
ncbi:VolA/Pla-1 family phospholipase [Ferrimonas senticii]|uniref:VolA/Pla-1 family phospholipase n=1 Tax=Ferrimonas senticii TaxID=394566 RepID=UPI00041FA7B0|nr:VolA/Pla-1 family phospholipase [Ferrimonas senticii]